MIKKPADYLSDPEQEAIEIGETSYEPIQAEDPEEAEEICEELATEYGLHLEGVDQRGSKDFDCLFRGRE